MLIAMRLPFDCVIWKRSFGMKTNQIKTLWENGQTVINGWLHTPNTWTAEVMATQGWDSLTVDMQHGLMGIETAIQMIQVISNCGVVPLARVTWNDPGMMMKLLDGGAYGIICPMINTRAEAEAFVKACRYPPDGYRSSGPTRASLFAGADYVKHANHEILTFAMIETVEALDNIEGIASVPGLDAFYIGPGDLKLSLTGESSMDNTDPVFMEALARILAAARKHRLRVGIHTASTDYARLMIEKGFQFITIKADTVFLREAARQAVASIRSIQQEKTASSAY